MSDCQQDYVEVYTVQRDGSQSLMGRYCEAHQPPPVLLSGMNEMIVIFESDKEHSNAGFFGYYYTEHYTLPKEIGMHIEILGMKVYYTVCE